MTWASNRLKLWKQHRAEQRQKATERIAHTLYQRRVLLNRHGDQQSDWSKAEKIVRSSLRQALFSINGSLISNEKRFVEPFNQHLKDSAFFDIVDRISPALEAMGVLFIPVALFWATFTYERQREFQANERLQQETVQNYINQLSEILLNVEGDLRSPENQRIRAIATAATYTLLNDPILNGERKGQVIGFLSQMELVQGSENTNENLEQGAIVSLRGVDLRGADLNNAKLHRADLRYANLRYAYLFSADLRGGDLRLAKLTVAELRLADLRGADLSDADLRGADLGWVKNWTDEQLGKGFLCNTILPEGSKLDPNRDCPK